MPIRNKLRVSDSGRLGTFETPALNPHTPLTVLLPTGQHKNTYIAQKVLLITRIVAGKHIIFSASDEAKNTLTSHSIAH